MFDFLDLLKRRAAYIMVGADKVLAERFIWMSINKAKYVERSIA